MTEHEAKRLANARKPRHEAPAWHRDSAEFGISLGHEGMDGISAENFAHDMIDLCDQYDELLARLSAAEQALRVIESHHDHYAAAEDCLRAAIETARAALAGREEEKR